MRVGELIPGRIAAMMTEAHDAWPLPGVGLTLLALRPTGEALPIDALSPEVRRVEAMRAFEVSSVRDPDGWPRSTRALLLYALPKSSPASEVLRAIEPAAAALASGGLLADLTAEHGTLCAIDAHAAIVGGALIVEELPYIAPAAFGGDAGPWTWPQLTADSAWVRALAHALGVGRVRAAEVLILVQAAGQWDDAANGFALGDAVELERAAGWRGEPGSLAMALELTCWIFRGREYRRFLRAANVVATADPEAGE